MDLISAWMMNQAWFIFHIIVTVGSLIWIIALQMQISKKS